MSDEGIGAKGGVDEKKGNSSSGIFRNKKMDDCRYGGQRTGRCGDNSQVPEATEMEHIGIGRDPAPHLLGIP